MDNFILLLLTNEFKLQKKLKSCLGAKGNSQKDFFAFEEEKETAGAINSSLCFQKT